MTVVNDFRDARDADTNWSSAMDYRDLDLDDLSDAQLAAIVQALRDSDGGEPTKLLTLLEGEIADRKRRGELQ
jgi:hypothetical protein